jgi:quercetin dioxygenase-like cupin family protein
MSEARGVVSVDDDKVRVTTWTFEAAGVATGRHRHEFDYVVVPVTGGTFKVVDLDGSEREMEQVAGSPYLGTAGTEHDVVNPGDHETVFVEIELKR